jgi:hypothetical protein
MKPLKKWQEYIKRLPLHYEPSEQDLKIWEKELSKYPKTHIERIKYAKIIEAKRNARDR